MVADVTEMYVLAADLAAAGPQAQAQGRDLVAKVAGDIADTAKALVPVDTGATKNSIGVDVNQSGEAGTVSAVVGPTTEYAPHLEFGTVNMQPYPFMGPAAEMHTPTFEAAVAALGGDIL